jgi:hypothetical protein
MKRAMLTWAVMVGALVGSAGSLWAEAAAPTPPERFDGQVVDTQGAVRGRSIAFFTLHVDRYSTNEEILELVTLLQEKGQDAVQDKLWDMEEKGWIQVGNSLGYHAAVIRSLPTDSGRTIRVFTDRPIQFFESRRGLRSRDYPFGIIELQLDAEGKGEGQLIAAASAGFSKEGRLVIESYGTEPFRILNVKTKKVKGDK